MIPTTDWKIRIPVDLAAKADMLFLDPVRGNIRYGARSALSYRAASGKHIEELAKPIDNLEKPVMMSIPGRLIPLLLSPFKRSHHVRLISPSLHTVRKNSTTSASIRPCWRVPADEL